MPNRPIMAFITAQYHCVSIINAARKMAEEISSELIVLTIQPIKVSAQSRAKSFKCLDSISKECGVDITVCYSDNPILSLKTQALTHLPIHIFTGADNGFVSSFHREYKYAPISVVGEKVIYTIPAEYDVLKTAN